MVLMQEGRMRLYTASEEQLLLAPARGVCPFGTRLLGACPRGAPSGPSEAVLCDVSQGGW